MNIGMPRKKSISIGTDKQFFVAGSVVVVAVIPIDRSDIDFRRTYFILPSIFFFIIYISRTRFYHQLLFFSCLCVSEPTRYYLVLDDFFLVDKIRGGIQRCFDVSFGLIWMFVFGANDERMELNAHAMSVGVNQPKNRLNEFNDIF